MNEAPYNWFFSTIDLLRESGVPTQITSGMACVFRQKTSLNTKDCDIIILGEWEKAFEILSKLQRQGHDLVYRSPFSAPLDSRWMRGGWTSHFEWTGNPVAKLDIFGSPPRVLNDIGSDYFSTDETIASIKMTQRIRDWSTVHEMGLRLLKTQNQKGFLYLQTAEGIKNAMKAFSLSPEIIQQRPLLQKMDDFDISTLQAMIEVERKFWMSLDRHRINHYRNCSKPYILSAREILKEVTDLHRQHKLLLEIALEKLPFNPLEGKFEEVVGLALDEALKLVDRSQFSSELLPQNWARFTLIL